MSSATKRDTTDRGATERLLEAFPDYGPLSQAYLDDLNAFLNEEEQERKEREKKNKSGWRGRG